jgi:hypothetical protein
MHLYKKWPKYAFAYAHMQMHNYPKPKTLCLVFEVAERMIYSKLFFKLLK